MLPRGAAAALQKDPAATSGIQLQGQGDLYVGLRVLRVEGLGVNLKPPLNHTRTKSIPSFNLLS